MQQPKHNNYTTRLNFGFLFIGLLCIIVGIAYLLNSLRILGITFNADWPQLIPLGIIFIGLSLLSRTGRLSIIIGLIVTTASIGIVSNAIFRSASLESTRHIIETQSIRIPIEPDITIAHIYITVGDGDITITSGSNDLVEGEFTTNFTKLSMNNDIENDMQGVALGSNGIWQGFGKKINTFNLLLNQDIPIRLYLGAATANMNIDLAATHTEYLGIRGISSSATITVGNLIQSQTFEFNTPEGSLIFSIPKDTGVQIMALPDVQLKEIPDFDKVGSSMYKSKGYNAAQNTVTIKLVAPISKLLIEWR
ncbi:MAG: toast rack family protein [bacterium]